LKNVDKEKIPKDVDYDEVRKLFVTPEVTDASKIELKWGEPDREGLLQFLVTERQFNPERIQKGIDKLIKARAGGQQMRMDSFFKPMPVDSSSSSKKRKVEEPPKKGKGGEKKQKK
jgi:flap endonuclease-1